MTLHVVTYTDPYGESSHIVGIYSSAERAEAAKETDARRILSTAWQTFLRAYDVETFELDA